MGYAALILGIAGMLGFWLVYFKVSPRSVWYEIGMLGWIMSWLLWVFGIWMVWR